MGFELTNFNMGGDGAGGLDIARCPVCNYTLVVLIDGRGPRWTCGCKGRERKGYAPDPQGGGAGKVKKEAEKYEY